MTGVPKSAGFAFEAADGIVASLVLNGSALPSATPPAIVLLSGLAVLTSLTSTLISFVNRNYALAPTPEVVSRLADAPEEWIRWRLIGNLLEALDVNRAKLQQKARFLTGGQFALLVGLALIGGYSLYASLSGGT